MTRLFFIPLLICISTSLAAQPVFTYGADKVEKDELLRAYNKNKTPATDKEKALREYLDLYIRFKLKVKAAMELRLDTLDNLKQEVSNFRTQVQESYMNDERGVAALVKEAFDRSQRDLQVLHFFVATDGRQSSADSIRAVNAINAVYDELSKGKTNYTEIAETVSSRFFPVKKSELGFIAAFSVPYQYENVIYGLKQGETAKPYRSASGWHVFKVTDERNSAGRWKVAQILLAFPPEGTPFNRTEYKEKADSLYRLLQKGANFGELAKEVSQDKLTYLNGGEMPEFGTGRFDAAFESEVFKLKKDGELSRPIQTPFGFHIVKRLAQTPTPSDPNDAGFLYELKQKVLQDDRITSAREKFIRDVIVKTTCKRSTAIKDAQLFKMADSVKPGMDVTAIRKFAISAKPVFIFPRQTISAGDFLNFVYDYKSSDLYRNESNNTLLEKYKEATALEYYKKNLEQYNTEFRYQMQEFKEGNMLFEVMERNVWSKAANDTEGLQQLYKTKKTGYLWPESADVLIFNCGNAKAASDGIAQMKNGWSWKAVADSSNGAIQADSARYELMQIPLPEGATAGAGLLSDPIVNSMDGTAIFVKILRLYPAGQQRSFEEARGLVINDYQAKLEEEWINQLKKKYPVKVDEGVFRTLIK
jgi:peptidyl-prolyl cis-trans isomerase SurA